MVGAIPRLPINAYILNEKYNKILYFSADGNYEVRYKSNVLIYPDGEVLWIPPAIYQVSTQVVTVASGVTRPLRNQGFDSNLLLAFFCTNVFTKQ